MIDLNGIRSQRKEMCMDIFIAWSLDRSKIVAETVKKCLENVFEKRVNVWLSTTLESGQEWFSELEKGLNSAKLGILCLTPENIFSRWIHWEAASIISNRQDKSAVIPLCLDLMPIKIPYPLSQFNAVLADKMGLIEIVRKIYRDIFRDDPDNSISTYVPDHFVVELDKLKQQISIAANVSNLDKFARDIVTFSDNYQIVEYIVSQIKRLHPGRDHVFPVFICGSAAIGKSTFVKLLRNRIDSDPGNDFMSDILPTDSYSMSKPDKIQNNLQGYEEKSHRLKDFICDFKKLTINHQPVLVKPYSHESGQFGASIKVEPKNILFVEGVYSFHPQKCLKLDHALCIYLLAKPSKVRELKFAADIMYRNKTIQNAFTIMRENYKSYEENIYNKYFNLANEVIHVTDYWHYERD
jgi:uridine kinase